MQSVCSLDCAIHSSKKARAWAAKEDRKTTRVKLEKLKTRSTWMKEAQREFNRYIRERDRVAGFGCISSGRALDWSGNATDAGHFRSVGSAPHLRFNEDNCHAQSKHANRYLSGDAVNYRMRLIERIGLERVEALEADQTPRHYDISDLKAIKEKYKKMARELKKNAA